MFQNKEEIHKSRSWPSERLQTLDKVAKRLTNAYNTLARPRESMLGFKTMKVVVWPSYHGSCGLRDLKATPTSKSELWAFWSKLKWYQGEKPD